MNLENIEDPMNWYFSIKNFYFFFRILEEEMFWREKILFQKM